MTRLEIALPVYWACFTRHPMGHFYDQYCRAGCFWSHNMMTFERWHVLLKALARGSRNIMVRACTTYNICTRLYAVQYLYRPPSRTTWTCSSTPKSCAWSVEFMYCVQSYSHHLLFCQAEGAGGDDDGGEFEEGRLAGSTTNWIRPPLTGSIADPLPQVVQASRTAKALGGGEHGVLDAESFKQVQDIWAMLIPDFKAVLDAFRDANPDCTDIRRFVMPGGWSSVRQQQLASMEVRTLCVLRTFIVPFPHLLCPVLVLYTGERGAAAKGATGCHGVLHDERAAFLQV